jgi:hypothetical protein
MFMDQYLATPFTICWFDFVNDIVDNAVKTGYLIISVRHDLLLLYTTYNIGEEWVLTPYRWVIAINKSFSEIQLSKTENLTLRRFGVDFSELNESKVNIAVYEMKNGLRMKMSKESEKVVLATLNFFLYLFSCKNISTKTHHPPKRLNKKRIKSGRPPVIQHKTLQITLPSNALRSTSNKHASGIMPFHLCRGHFKTYTKEKPLFGHIVGRYWWQPQARGRKKVGVVTKDYDVKADPELEPA